MTSARTRTALALTLAGSSLLIATAAHADPACGTPAVDAVFQTVHTDAVSHLELKWSTTVVDSAAVAAWDEPDVVVPATYKTVTVVDKEAYVETVVDEEASEETVVDKEAWTEKVVDKEAWTETVVDKEAWTETVVDQLSYGRYVVTQQEVWTKYVEWRRRYVFGGSDYQMLPEGVNPGGTWTLTGYWQWRLTQPQQGYWETVPAVTHTVDHPAETHTVDHPEESHTVDHPEESHVVTHPAETHTVDHPEVNHEEQVVDVAEHSVPGLHHDAVAAVTHQDYQWAATSPGEEWVQTEESRLVVDSEAKDTQVVLTPAVPAGGACATPADPGTGDGGAGNGGNGNGPAKAPANAPAAAPAADAASAVPALAHTGADGTTELLALGGLLVLAGGGLKRAVRQRA